MKYEVVCAKSYLDVGLLLETYGTKFKKILGRNSTYSSGSCYGGIEYVEWIHTGVFLSKKEWNKITFNKSTDQILYELNIEKSKIVKSVYKNKSVKSISWYQLWKKIGKQPFHRTRNAKVKVLIDGELKECVLIFAANGSDFHLEILE